MSFIREDNKWFNNNRTFNGSDDVDEPIKIFIGTSDDSDTVIERIYLYTLLKNTKSQLDITFLRPKNFPEWKRQGWGTPFTCFRYAIPELCGFKGRAIYTDCDMINFRDISYLWKTSLQGKPFGMVWDSLQQNNAKWKNTAWERGWWCDSVMLIDCEKAKEWVDPISVQADWEGTYKWHFMEKIGSPDPSKTKDIVQRLDSRWNSFDGTETDYPHKPPYKNDKVNMPADQIWQLHLTALSYQPWHPKYSPHAKASHKRQDLMNEFWKLNKEIYDIINVHEL